MKIVEEAAARSPLEQMPDAPYLTKIDRRLLKGQVLHRLHQLERELFGFEAIAQNESVHAEVSVSLQDVLENRDVRGLIVDALYDDFELNFEPRSLRNFACTCSAMREAVTEKLLDLRKGLLTLKLRAGFMALSRAAAMRHGVAVNDAHAALNISTLQPLEAKALSFFFHTLTITGLTVLDTNDVTFRRFSYALAFLSRDAAYARVFARLTWSAFRAALGARLNAIKRHVQTAQ